MSCISALVRLRVARNRHKCSRATITVEVGLQRKALEPLGPDPQDLPNCKSSHSQAMRDSLLRHVLMLLLTPPREDIPSIRANWVSWALVTWLDCGDVGPERSIPCMMFSTVRKVCGAWLERAGFLH